MHDIDITALYDRLRDEALAINCSDQGEAIDLLQAVVDHEDAPIHSEIIPATNEATGMVKYYTLHLKRPFYEYKYGWFTVDDADSATDLSELRMDSRGQAEASAAQ